MTQERGNQGEKQEHEYLLAQKHAEQCDVQRGVLVPHGALDDRDRQV